MKFLNNPNNIRVKSGFPIFKKHYYLAYGSNLNLKQMKYRCPNAKIVDKLNLEDYRLVYKGTDDNFAYLTIEENQGSFVPLGVYELNMFDVLSLDMYEGYPNSYTKEYFKVEHNDKIKKAMLYVMNKNFDYHIPTDKYVTTCKNGYDNFDFDPDILDKAFTDTKDIIERVRKK